MSVYGVHKVCYRVHHDAEFRQQLREDPGAALADCALEPSERQALLEGDVAQLYAAGAHGYLLHHLARHEVLGLTGALYSERMRRLRQS